MPAELGRTTVPPSWPSLSRAAKSTKTCRVVVGNAAASAMPIAQAEFDPRDVSGDAPSGREVVRA
ncbi:MAG TPA: hypothetical protein VES60_07460, partial [Nakamurella sp.]|nr:hypothetical protein [Nakamurella sp.]